MKILSKRLTLFPLLSLISLMLFIGLFSPIITKAATEFISVVDTDGLSGDYSTLSSWEQFNQTNLTLATTLVFSHGGITGSITDINSVTGATSGATADVVHATSTQILLENISGTFQSGEQVYETLGTNYVTTSDAGDSAISVASCQATTSVADGTAVTIDGWTTSAANYIKVYTTEANRHDGKWNTGRYRLTLSSTALTISESYVTIEGLQIHITNSAGDRHGIYSNSVLSDILIDSCIIRGNGNTEFGTNVGIMLGGISDGSSWKAINSIFYDQKTCGIWDSYSSGTTLEVYNCVFYNIFGTGILQRRSTLTVKNTAVFNTSDDFFDDNGGLTIDYCASDDGDGDHTVTPSDWSTVFEDYANGDFHLKSTDMDLKDAGTDLTAEGFTDDIDGSTRTGTWDIGADEWAMPIYRSVGPSASSYLERGIDGSGNDLNISGSTATFASDLGNDVGVGDAIQYDTAGAAADPIDAICFIHGRTDETHYTVKNSLGGAPTATIADQDWSIFRAYDSLSHAESGDENDSIDNTVETFENWADGKDIVASNEQWNIACYNGQGDAADQTAVTINGWTTGANNYIKVYTPVDSDEVGTSQRHSGVWDSGKYRLEVNNALPLNIQTTYTRIEGLQINQTGTWNQKNINVQESNIEISYNIIKNESTGTTHGIACETASTTGIKIWNNIIYDFNTNGIRVGDLSTDAVVIYNNTVLDSGTWNYEVWTDRAIFKNNIGDDGGSGDFAFGSTDGSRISCNASGDSTADNNGGTGNKVDQNFVFTDFTNDNFHLSSSDTSAKDAGADLSSDSNLSFSDDIDGDTRPSPYWDIGADEYPAKQKVKIEGNAGFEGSVEFR